MAPPPPPANPGAAAKQVVAQLRTLWIKAPRPARFGGVAVLALVIGAIAYLTLAPGPAPWVAVSGSMSHDDVVELSGLLASRNIPQRVDGAGKSVEVPPDRLIEARMIASAAGLPRGGTGLESFDKTAFGRTRFDEEVQYQRAMQGELVRSISSLAPVESARVHVAPGNDSPFRDNEKPPTASVTLRVRPGVTLTTDQVRGVKQLVASAITGMTADHVAVIDQHGTVLSADDDTAKKSSGAAEHEAAIGQRVRGLLERIVGPGHVAVVVSVEMDRRRVSQSEEIWDRDRAAIRSETHAGALAPSPAINSGIAGVQGNLAGTQGAGGGAGSAAGGAMVGTDTKNWEITRTVRQTDEPEEKIGRVRLAILVDHRTDAAGVTAPLPPGDLAQIAQLARQAAGLDEGRGDALELQSFAFIADAPPAPALPAIEPATLPLPLPVPLPIAAGAGAALLVLAVVIATLLRRRRRRNQVVIPVLALPAPLSELERALDGPAETNDLPKLAAAGQRSLEERVLGAVRSDMPRAARVLASWLSEPDPKPSKS